MAEKQPKVSIVFVNFNGEKDSAQLIDSIKKIKYKNYNIIVVDNKSSKKLSSKFKQKYKKDIVLIENSRNTGLAEGTNIGIREALKKNSKYVLVMNNDMIVKKDFLNPLVEVMESNSNIAVSSSKMYYMKPKNMIWSAGCDYHTYGYKSRQQGEIDKTQDEKNKEVDALDCVLLMRSSVLKKIGLLDSKFFIICEFTEWCLRAKNKGYKILYVPASIIWHKISSSLNKIQTSNKTEVYYNSRNWLLTIKKNKSSLYFLWVFFLHSTIFALIRLMKYSKQRKAKLILNYYIGTWHALTDKTPLKLYPYKS
jgi:GT2 family glycosyltransferase